MSGAISTFVCQWCATHLPAYQRYKTCRLSASGTAVSCAHSL